jgi:V/A-type H+-transporting ATPase subunit I
MLVMALCVFGWGAITGNWFGLQWGGLSWFTDDKDSQHIKLFCFFLGAGHMVLAHLWKSRLVHGLRERLANIGWAMFLGGNFFTVKALLIDNGDFSNFTIPKWLYIIGTALILMCGIDWRKAGDVINAPFTFINSFGDLLSYIRLFAVGLSSLEITRAFNEMGATIWNGNVWLIPVGVLVILLGHALNISLALMGVLVHGIRLNTLEFSGHIGVEWSGKPYEPFK